MEKAKTMGETAMQPRNRALQLPATLANIRSPGMGDR